MNWKIGIYAFCNWGPLMIFAGLWGISFLHVKYQIPHNEAAGLINFLWVGLMIGSPFIGWICTKLPLRNTLMLLTSLFGAISSYAILFIPLSNQVLPFFLFLLGVASSGQILSFDAIKEQNPSNHTATAIGFNNMALVSGSTILQPLSGWILQQQWDHTLVNNIPQFSVENYTTALTIMPLAFLFSMVILYNFKTIKDYKEALITRE